jgi:hypothetical protein
VELSALPRKLLVVLAHGPATESEVDIDTVAGRADAMRDHAVFL